MRRSDDLPVPFGPTRPTRSRGPTESEASWNRTASPKASERPLAVTRLMRSARLTFLQGANKRPSPPRAILTLALAHAGRRRPATAPGGSRAHREPGGASHEEARSGA